MPVGVLIAFVFLANPAAAANVHIHIQGFAFVPTPATIAVGDVVTWDNHDGATHTTTDNNCPRANGPGPCEWDSINMITGATFTHSFLVGGVFEYKCTIHNFLGKLTVTDPNNAPDLAVDNLVATNPANVLDLNHKIITVTEKNVGGEGSDRQTVRVEYFYQGNWNLIGQQTITPLPAGATRTLSFTWTTTAKVGDFQVRALVDSANVIAEGNEANNVSTITVSLLTPPGTVPGTDLMDPL